MAFKHFHMDEFRCKCGCRGNHISMGFVAKLDRAREFAGVPFVINSGYRCPEHNARVGGVQDSAHVKGLAADIMCLHSRQRFRIIEGLLKAGITRIGQTGTFLHADDDREKPQEVIFFY